MSLFGKSSRGKGRFGMDADFEAKMRLLEAKSEEQEYEKLKQKVEKLSLVCEALWAFIRHQHPELTEEALLKRIEELKVSDEKTETCPKCGRIMNKNQNRCLYCGTEGKVLSFFDTL